MSTRTLDARLALCIVTVTLAGQLVALLALTGSGDRISELGRVFGSGFQPAPLPPGQVAGPDAARTVTVPEGNGAPVITDGIFSPGEWDDARRVALGGANTLHLKQYRGVVFVGVRGDGGVGPSDLCLAVPGGQILKFHVSAQLAETVLPREGADPAPRFGFTTDWYANELRRDMAQAERLERAGKTPIEIIRATSYPSDGIEFAIRQTKVPGNVWLMRLWASVMNGDKPGMITYPPGTAERSTTGWLELRLR